jgi:hypothetical protein
MAGRTAAAPPLPPPDAVVDARLAAGRGAAFSAGERRRAAEAAAANAGDAFSLPIGHRIEEGVDLAGVEQASLDTPLAETSRGHALLRLLGWTPGEALGRRGGPAAEPLHPGDALDNVGRLGLGRRAVAERFFAPELVQRRALESEAQAGEGAERAARRAAEAARAARVRGDVADALRTFLCEVCAQQFANAAQLDEHLSGYGHQHAKRRAEARVAACAGREGGASREDRRRAERELARQVAAARRAAGLDAAPAEAGAGGSPPPPPPPSGSTPPPLPPRIEDGAPEEEARAGGWAEPELAPEAAAAPAPPLAAGFGLAAARKPAPLRPAVAFDESSDEDG